MSPLPAASRRVAATLATSLVGAVVLLGAGPAPLARAETTAVPGVLSLAQQQSSTVSVPVPDGVTPTGLTGRLAVTESLDSELTFTVGDRVAARVPATSGPVSIAVTTADVVADRLDVTMTYAVDEDCPSGAGPAPASLGDLVLESSGAEPAPSTLENFFPDFSARIDVVVPGRADDALVGAALNAVTALTRRYDGQTPVVLSSARAQLPRVGLGQRLVRLVAAQGPAQARVGERFGLPELTLTGSPEALRTAVRGLSVGTDLTAELPTTEPLLEQSLAELGVAQVALSGPGPSEETFDVPQDAFGGRIDSLRIQASGVHSALPDDAEVHLDTYVDEVLLDSRVLDPAAPRFSVDVTTDADLASVSTVEMLLRTESPGASTPSGSATPDGSADPQGSPGPDPAGTCRTGPPSYVVLDTTASTITATPGSESDTGFDVFPQALGRELTVALRPKAGQRIDAAGDASYLVSALQRAAGGLLDVAVVSADDLVNGDGSGLLVGADIDDAADLDAPLQYEESVDPDDPAGELDLDVTRLFAALEAVPGAEREVLMLGAFGPGGRDEQRALTRRTAQAVADAGWSSLQGDLYVATPETAPVSVESGTTRPAAESADDAARGWWLAAAVAALLGLLGYQASRSVRADRARSDAADTAGTTER